MTAPELDNTCEHCEDGHYSPSKRSWATWVTSERLDGQPPYVIVSRPNGAHVAEVDADWIRWAVNEAPGELERLQDENRQLRAIVDQVAASASICWRGLNRHGYVMYTCGFCEVADDVRGRPRWLTVRDFPHASDCPWVLAQQIT